MQSCLYEGRVRHRRFAPRQHVFEYRLYYAWLDLDELDEVFGERWLWSIRRSAPVRFMRADYLGDARIPLKQAVMNKVEQETGRRPTGPIRLLTHLRQFGYVFNPVSFYYCYDHDGHRVETIVAEITNTPWGERHAYVLPIDLADTESHWLHFKLEKIFHVSPFMPMDMSYEWTFTAPGENLSVHMVNRRQNQLAFDATLRLTRKPLNAYHCARMLAVYPLVTVKVIAAIYWQAFRLRLKRIPFYPHPHRQKSDQDADGVEVKSS